MLIIFLISLFTIGNSLNKTDLIINVSPSASNMAVIALRNSSRFVAAYLDSNSNSNAFFQIFDTNGTKIGPERKANSLVAYQGIALVALDSKFVLFYAEYAQSPVY